MQKAIAENIILKIERVIDLKYESNPNIKIIDIKRMQFHITCICFTLLNAIKISDILALTELNTIKNIIESMKNYNLINSVTKKFYDDNQLFFDKVFEDFNSEFTFYKGKIFKVSEIYEKYLTNDLHFIGNKIKMFINKASRDRAGAYYTPEELAKTSVRQAIDLYIQRNLGIEKFSLREHNQKDKILVFELLRDVKIIDLSCGAGEFLHAVLDYVNNYLRIKNGTPLLNEIIDNLWGIDVDPIALQIVKCSLIDIQGNLSNVNSINDRFMLGNPLISIKNEFQEEEKIMHVASNIIYCQELGMNLFERFKSVNNSFDLVIGNPPWEKIRFEEKKFFSTFDEEISSISQKKRRDERIKQLKYSNPNLLEYYTLLISNMEISKTLIKKNSALSHALRGELNTYALFTDLAIYYVRNTGQVCLVVKSSIVTSSNNSALFNDLVLKERINCIYEFINSKKIFSIDSRERFCILFLSKTKSKEIKLAMSLTAISEMLIPDRLSILTPEMIVEINPQTKMLPNIKTKLELDLLLDSCKKYRKLSEVFKDCRFGRLVHLTSHSEYISKNHRIGYIPIYEGKFIEQYDGKYSTFAGVSEQAKYANKAYAIIINDADKKSSECIPVSRYFINKEKWEKITKNYQEEYTLMWRSLTSSTNTRTTIATILPHLPTCQSIQLLQIKETEHLVLLLALFNSIVFDYFVRLKLNGIDLTQAILRQIPVPEVSAFEDEVIFSKTTASIKKHIFDRIYALYNHEKRLADLFCKLGYETVNVVCQFENKKIIMGEIDILVSMAYKIDKKMLRFIACQFKGFYSKEQVEMFINLW